MNDHITPVEVEDPGVQRLMQELRETPTYSDVQMMADGRIVCICQLVYTWAILSDLTTFGYEDRWCYSSYEKARASLDIWVAANGEGEPYGWHRHPSTGRRRPDGDVEREYINL